MKSEITIPQIGNMLLKSTVLEAINTITHRIELARILKVGEQTIIKYIENNDLKLTQYAPLQYIGSVVGATDAIELIEQPANVEQ